MEHFGDVTKIKGNAAPPVDVIIGGSPCQDLSVAGKRAGLKGERSGLFMEQIRIIKEMREASAKNGATEIRPRYFVWENVPGAFSTNGGEDFRAVLEETVRIIDESAVVPRPSGGKWNTCGCIVGDGFSVAWRVFDAQFWGVPQRRRRIAIVADFGCGTAPEILFERKGMSWSSSESGETRQRAAADTSGSAGKAIGFNYLTGSKAHGIGAADEQAETLRAGYTGAAVCYSIDRAAFNQGEHAKYDPSISANGISQTLVSRGPGAVCYAIGNGQADQTGLHTGLHKVAGALNCMHDQQAIINDFKVRRLTPIECERLQGFPDGWTNIGAWTDGKGKKRYCTDGARYKALGNSIALPPWRWILKRLCACYNRPATMASLFDGIGGFPLIWEELNGKGSCLWASEIEEFPIAVTKNRI